MARSRRKVSEEVTYIYCRRCQEEKHPNNFYKATDTFLDKNGYMSICVSCINEIYDVFMITHRSQAKTILEMCRVLNVKFDEEALDALNTQLDTYEKAGKETTNIFGIYKSRLMSIQKTRITDRKMEVDFTFYEPTLEQIQEATKNDDGHDLEYYQERWGGENPTLDMSDYLFLEKEFDKWRRSTKCDTHAEEVYLKEICFLELGIRKRRIEGKPVDSLLKTFREMTKESALTPAQQSQNSTGKSADAFGSWIKDIENKEPAEVWQDMTKYKDMDGIEEDIEDIKRSIRNFMTDSRDFSPLELEKITEGEEPDEEEDMDDAREKSDGESNGED